MHAPGRKLVITALAVLVVGAPLATSAVDAAPAGAAVTIVQHQLPAGDIEPAGITEGSDGNLWVTYTLGQTYDIGRITPSGHVTDFRVPSPVSEPLGIVSGSDGNLWFTESNANRIGRITTSGVVTEFLLPHPGSEPQFITPGPDGALWFTEIGGRRIGRITTGGAITEFPLPGAGAERKESPPGRTARSGSPIRPPAGSDG